MIVKLHSSKTRGRGKVTETRASALVGHTKFKEAGYHLFSVHLSELPVHIKIILHTFCAFTIEFTAHQLHTQRACPATNHGDDADVLGHDGGVKEVGLCAVVIRVPHKNLQHANTGNEALKKEMHSVMIQGWCNLTPCPSVGRPTCKQCMSFRQSCLPPWRPWCTQLCPCDWRPAWWCPSDASSSAC